ncbi:MAG: hypothetical protein QM706_13545 [Nitrospira sp.]
MKRARKYETHNKTITPAIKGCHNVVFLHLKGNACRDHEGARLSVDELANCHFRRGVRAEKVLDVCADGDRQTEVVMQNVPGAAARSTKRSGRRTWPTGGSRDTMGVTGWERGGPHHE